MAKSIIFYRSESRFCLAIFTKANTKLYIVDHRGMNFQGEFSPTKKKLRSKKEAKRLMRELILSSLAPIVDRYEKTYSRYKKIYNGQSKKEN